MKEFNVLCVSIHIKNGASFLHIPTTYKTAKVLEDGETVEWGGLSGYPNIGKFRYSERLGGNCVSLEVESGEGTVSLYTDTPSHRATAGMTSKKLREIAITNMPVFDGLDAMQKYSILEGGLPFSLARRKK